MGVYIKGMEMPKSCYKCPLRRRNGIEIVCPIAHESFSVADTNILEYRLGNCPLIPVPEHGDLIDRATLRAEVKKHATPSDAWVFSLIRTAPTIVEADKEGEG